MASQQHKEPARITTHYGFALLAILSLLGTTIPGYAMMSAAAEVARQDSNAGRIAGVMVVGWFVWGGMWTVIWLVFAINHALKNRR
ncbi:hypothetical protein [Mycobacterium sp. OTB74]|jgi:hypothetical protein|uniref:hypothetical protein n=1 Tax=Mycobacterium sp. OTB74 TaxID=1853452 RepID=UPI002476D322|nr:hypothetical protein [Mycobacterium sp. OTB74]MDH6246812.1 hypothetical protein [Mycobacterium sp. OTB74]